MGEYGEDGWVPDHHRHDPDDPDAQPEDQMRNLVGPRYARTLPEPRPTRVWHYSGISAIRERPMNVDQHPDAQFAPGARFPNHNDQAAGQLRAIAAYPAHHQLNPRLYQNAAASLATSFRGVDSLIDDMRRHPTDPHYVPLEHAELIAQHAGGRHGTLVPRVKAERDRRNAALDAFANGHQYERMKRFAESEAYNTMRESTQEQREVFKQRRENKRSYDDVPTFTDVLRKTRRFDHDRDGGAGLV